MPKDWDLCATYSNSAHQLHSSLFYIFFFYFFACFLPQEATTLLCCPLSSGWCQPINGSNIHSCRKREKPGCSFSCFLPVSLNFGCDCIPLLKTQLLLVNLLLVPTATGFCVLVTFLSLLFQTWVVILFLPIDNGTITVYTWLTYKSHNNKLPISLNSIKYIQYPSWGYMLFFSRTLTNIDIVTIIGPRKQNIRVKFWCWITHTLDEYNDHLLARGNGAWWSGAYGGIVRAGRGQGVLGANGHDSESL